MPPVSRPFPLSLVHRRPFRLLQALQSFGRHFIILSVVPAVILKIVITLLMPVPSSAPVPETPEYSQVVIHADVLPCRHEDLYADMLVAERRSRRDGEPVRYVENRILLGD